MEIILILSLFLIICYLLYQSSVFKKENYDLKLELGTTKAVLEEKEKIYKDNLTSLKENYEKQNEKLLSENKNMLNEDSKKILNEIFEPLKNQVEHYTKRLTQNETKLETEIKNMFDYSQNIKGVAENLANILKGDKKARGNFGELQLKNVLNNSGLIEGQQYKLQEQLITEDNKKVFPDAIVYLDNKKNIIIDAKFSLPNNFDFNEIDNKVCEEIANNIKKRVNELSKKPYASIDSNTYDFTILFIPYQNILDLAISVDSNIYQYAYKNKIYIATPNILFMALKTIDITWRYNKSNENTLKALERIGTFYDKFVGVLEDFNKLKNNIQKINNNIEDMDKKLISGNGNLTIKFKQLEKYKIKNKNHIPEEYIKNTNDY